MMKGESARMVHFEIVSLEEVMKRISTTKGSKDNVKPDPHTARPGSLTRELREDSLRNRTLFEGFDV